MVKSVATVLLLAAVVVACAVLDRDAMRGTRSLGISSPTSRLQRWTSVIAREFVAAPARVGVDGQKPLVDGRARPHCSGPSAMRSRGRWLSSWSLQDTTYPDCTNCENPVLAKTIRRPHTRTPIALRNMRTNVATGQLYIRRRLVTTNAADTVCSSNPRTRILYLI